MQLYWSDPNLFPSFVIAHLKKDIVSGKMVTVNVNYAQLKETRASARRVTNTSDRRHFLIMKYFKVNDNNIRQDIVYNVSL